jgi:hypothetical protein
MGRILASGDFLLLNVSVGSLLARLRARARAVGMGTPILTLMSYVIAVVG